jgi:hypothetical protein
LYRLNKLTLHTRRWRKKTAVADAWMSGGAAFEEDSHGVRKQPAHTLGTFTANDNPRLVKGLRQKVASINAATLQNMNNLVSLRMAQEPVALKDPDYFNNAETTSPQFREGARVAAKLVSEVASPRKEHKTVIIGGSDLARIAAAQSVNDMIPNIASALNITEAAAAEHVANKVSKDAVRPQSPSPSKRDARLLDGKSASAPNSQADTKTNRSGT